MHLNEIDYRYQQAPLILCICLHREPQASPRGISGAAFFKKESKVKNQCMLRVLAQSDDHRIDYCDHGLVHIHIGATSVRLDSEQARELAMMMGRAMRAVDLIELEAAASALAIVRPDETEVC